MVYENWVKENKVIRVQEVCEPNKNWRGLK
jgi:hypothetical protein